MDIIYFPELSVRYRGLTRPAAAKDALRCMSTAWTYRMRAAELPLTLVVCGWEGHPSTVAAAVVQKW